MKIFLGGTGCGKTHQAIKTLTKKGTVLVAVPTRQLAYDIFMSYEEITGVNTGEVHHTNNENTVVVFENLSRELILTHDSLFVDEVHFINDNERGYELVEFIKFARSNGKSVIGATATYTISSEMEKELGIEKVRLPSVTPIKKTQLKSWDAVVSKTAGTDGVKSILVFTKYKPTQEDVYGYADALGVDYSDAESISAYTSSAERLRIQKEFKEGKIRLLLSTNVLAQGVNTPAELVIIETNEWDDWELVQQKIGRAGRNGFGVSRAWYYLNYKPGRQQRHGVIEKPHEDVVTSYVRDNGEEVEIPLAWGVAWHEVPGGELKEYHEIRYSRRFLNLLAKRYLPTEKEAAAIQKLRMEEEKLKNILGLG